MRTRRHFLTTGFSLAAAGLAGTAALTGARRTLAEEAPPEATSVRLVKYSSTCLAPLYILDDLLREEGFTDIRYVASPEGTFSKLAMRGEADFGQDFCAPTIIQIDAGGAPMVILAGVHPGCLELFAQNSIRSVVDLKVDLKSGRNWKVGVSGKDALSADHVMLSILAASVGLDPTKDINWIAVEPPDQKELFAAGGIDALLTAPPWAQELHARKLGHVILNSGLDRPWSQYFCCVLTGASDFVRRNPIATKRVVRAVLRATDICAAKPDWVSQRLVDRGFAPRYDYVRQSLDDVTYRNWQDYDSEDSVRFWALRLRELGMIKSSPDKVIATSTDWRFIEEVRKELGI
jgi:NitT/TauT family transport system substrate-binding protein